jgi:hypothetical protein
MSKEQKDLEIKADELGKELGDEDAAAAAGGNVCGCVISGFGNEDVDRKNGNDDDCACVIAGGGEERNGKVRCFCSIAGGGADR